MAHLEVLEGDIQGTRIPLGKITCIGRGLEMDVRLDDLTVSKRHARVMSSDRGEFIVEDLGSSNGTFLNGAQVRTRVLSPGDRLRIGSTVMKYHTDSGEEYQDDGTRKVLNINSDTNQSSVITSVDVASQLEDMSEPMEGSTIQEVQRTNYRLRTLLEISQSIGRGLDETELLERILDRLFEVFPDTHRGFIILRDPDTGRLTPATDKVAGEEGEADGELEISETILDYVLQQKQAILSTDTQHDDRFATAQSIMDFSMRSVMCAPLMCEGLVLGFVLLDAREISESYDEEGLTLLAGIANQAALTIGNARLHKQLIKRERLEQDLRNAHRIQTSFLPKEPPRVLGYEFLDWYDPAQEVGGDFYDFISVPGGKVLAVVGDVSGKGITAALMMAKMTSNVRFFAAQEQSPGELLRQLNDLTTRTETDMFTTCVIMLLDPEEHRVVLANAGHCHPMLVTPDCTCQRIKGESGFPIGITPGAEYPEFDIELGEGDVLCAFTDGIIEAMNQQREQFGYPRLSEAMVEGCGTARSTLNSIQRGIRAHTGAAAQSDDLTLVCLSRLEPSRMRIAKTAQ